MEPGRDARVAVGIEVHQPEDVVRPRRPIAGPGADRRRAERWQLVAQEFRQRPGGSMGGMLSQETVDVAAKRVVRQGAGRLARLGDVFRMVEVNQERSAQRKAENPKPAPGVG